MRVGCTASEATAILAAMRDVASTGGAPSAADRVALISAARWMFALAKLDVDALPASDPATLAAAVSGASLRAEATRFLTVMALVDGVVDVAKLTRVVTYAAELGVHERSIADIAAVARGRIDAALGHMARDNMESVTGRAWAESADIGAWLLPYRGDGADPVLAARYRALASLPAGSFGRAFLEHFEHNGYAVPGEPGALNEGFCTPHDATHLLSEYDTTPRGEILVSTFTAAMHPVHPISGHVLPVIFSLHLGVRINEVAKASQGTLDPAEIWRAWARGERAGVDPFAPSWDFWSWVEIPLDELRARYVPS